MAQPIVYLNYSFSEHNVAGRADFPESFGTFIHLHESGFRIPLIILIEISFNKNVKVCRQTS